MAVKLSKQSRGLAVVALAISAFVLPGLASAEPEGGERGNWRARSEDGARHARAENRDNGGQRERHAPPEQARAAPQERTRAAPPQQSAPPQQQPGWSGNNGGGNSWGGRNRERSADQGDQRRGRNASNDIPQAAPPAPQQQPAQPGWAGRQSRTWTRDTNREGGGRNWTDANRHHENADRHRHDGRQRDRAGGYVSGGYYYGNISGDNQNYNDRDRDDHQWNRQWRNNSSYNWYSYRSSHPTYYRLDTYYSPYRNYSYRRLSIGYFLQSLFFGQNYQIHNPRYYRLPDVYGPYRWVRYYDDAVLVDIYSGEVVDVIYEFFW